MLITKDTSIGNFTINRYAPGEIVINEQIYTHSLIVSPSELLADWQPKNLMQLTTDHIDIILKLSPEVVLLGTGLKLEFPQQSILAALYNQNIGTEVMDTHAACRTYNVLTSEGRKVVAALLIE